MNSIVDYDLAQEIMGENFIGVDEIKKIKGFNLEIPEIVPLIPFTEEELKNKKNDYILILGLNKFKDGSAVNIAKMISIFGKNPLISEPCFYNQDWYEKEDFIYEQIEESWFLIRKKIYEDSRAKLPSELKEFYNFPTAIKCTYAFFVAWKSKNIILWEHEYIWCNNTDHNGDIIYVGRYKDDDGRNKNGFSIHRHLSLRSCYGCVD